MVVKKKIWHPKVFFEKRNKRISYIHTLLLFFEEFCRKSNIHGVRYFAERKLHWTERWSNFSIDSLQFFWFAKYIFEFLDQHPQIVVVHSNWLVHLLVQHIHWKYLDSMASASCGNARYWSKCTSFCHSIPHHHNLSTDKSIQRQTGYNFLTATY